MRARWAPVRRSHVFLDKSESGSPGALASLETGIIRRDRSCRIFRRGSSLLGSLEEFCERYLEARMLRTCELPELIVSSSCYVLIELAGWPRQLGSSTGEVPAYLVERHFERLSQREAWLEKGLEHSCAVRVGLVIPALSFEASCSSGTFAAAV